MKILALIPTSEVHPTPCSVTYPCELLEVEVVTVTRYPATRYPHLNRWHYEAIVIDHPLAHPGAPRRGRNGRRIVRIDRRVNRNWTPPKFPANVYTYEVQR